MTRKLFLIFSACLLIMSGVLLSGTAQAADNIVRIETSMGNILVRLDERKAPVTVANFLQYARSGFYDGTIFHRVIKGFMIQGGGMGTDMRPKRTMPPIKNEASTEMRNKRYTIAMARTADPNSATCQFFINTADNRTLDPDRAQDGAGYCVFGRVIQGKEVVDKIERVRTTTKASYFENCPVEPVIIKKVTVMETKD